MEKVTSQGCYQSGLSTPTAKFMNYFERDVSLDLNSGRQLDVVKANGGHRPIDGSRHGLDLPLGKGKF